MAISTTVNLIRTHFDYLFDDYGFSVISETHFESFDNWVIVLQSQDCRLRFFQDRGEVFVAASPLWSPPGWQFGPWFDLSVIVAFLSGGTEKLELEPKLGQTEQQLIQLTRVVQTYCDRIVELFKEENFSKKQSELELLRDRLDGEFWH